MQYLSICYMNKATNKVLFQFTAGYRLYHLILYYLREANAIFILLILLLSFTHERRTQLIQLLHRNSTIFFIYLFESYILLLFRFIYAQCRSYLTLILAFSAVSVQICIARLHLYLCHTAGELTCCTENHQMKMYAHINLLCIR